MGECGELVMERVELVENVTVGPAGMWLRPTEELTAGAFALKL
jgi:hypothetical protein